MFETTDLFSETKYKVPIISATQEAGAQDHRVQGTALLASPGVVQVWVKKV